MKLMTFDGPKGHSFEVPGFFKIASGESHKIDDHLAEAVVRANPKVPLTITDLPEREREGGSTRRAPATSQPEAHEGEGQPNDPNDKEE